jgi:hypothetical protein
VAAGKVNPIPDMKNVEAMETAYLLADLGMRYYNQVPLLLL